MLQQETQSAYLSASANGATQIGLHIMVYDALASDLLRAGEACRRRDIGARCLASNHALLLLGHLEAWAAGLDDQLLTESLQTFYQTLRQDIISFQAKGTFDDFARSSDAAQAVRGAWQAKEQSTMRIGGTSQTLAHASPTETLKPGKESLSFAWSA